MYTKVINQIFACNTGQRLLLIFLFITTISCNQSSSSKQASHAEKPNILFIFTDDQTYSSINSLGNNEIQTPNIDQLVNSGTTFTHAYNMGAWNGAVCLASRAMMISGRSVWRANQISKQWSKGIHREKTWGQLMKDAGYDTYMSGKWHVDVPADQVFNVAKNIRPGMPNDSWEHEVMVKKFDSLSTIPNAKPEDIMPVGYNRPKDENDSSWRPYDTGFGGFWEGGKHWSEVLKDDGKAFINKAKNSEKPFFMYLAFNAPHDPRQAPKSYVENYPLDSISLPASWLPNYPWQHDIGNGPSLRDEALAPFPRTPYATKVHIQEYYASITHLDEQIGEIIAALKASGKADNTYIILTSDHGLAIGRHGLIGKQSLYDHSIRVPLIIAGPGIPKGKKITNDVYLQDIMATSLELAGVNQPDYVEFNSFLSQAQGKSTERSYDAIYGCYVNFQRMVRKGNYKLIVYPTINKLLLFDLSEDPEEINNLADNPEYKTKIQRLFNELIKLQIQMNDSLDLKTHFPEFAQS